MTTSADPDVKLTPAEYDILRAAALGQSYVQIAHQRGRSYNTVKHQMNLAYRKLGASCLAQAMNILGWVNVTGESSTFTAAPDVVAEVRWW